ncbi:MAG TPA: hypothetical protein VLR71_21125 [Casimicrobiaceae bacterium]|nr:hypothetical protein [Casimicrobiaceae bacterium]
MTVRKTSALDTWGKVNAEDERTLNALAAELACTVGEVHEALSAGGPTVGDVRNFVRRRRGLGGNWQATRPDKATDTP